MRLAADNGEEGRQWRQNMKSAACKFELKAIEQLADRITTQVSAQLRLSEMIQGYQVDPEGLRVIRLALNSLRAALGAVVSKSHEIDMETYGQPMTVPQFGVYADYGSGLTAVEEIANDLGIQANAQEYAIAIVPSRRRPSPYAIQAMHFMCEAMDRALTEMGA